MHTKVIDGKKIAKKIESRIKKKLENIKQPPKLAVVFIGENKASETYIRKKREKAEELGFGFNLFKYPKNINNKEIKKEIENIQKENKVGGIIIQLPIPEKFYPNLLDTVKPKFDVDCLGSHNLGKLVKGENDYTPPTAGAIMEILNHTNTDLKGKKVTIVGTGLLVGRPAAILAMNKQATVTTCNIYTEDLKKECKKSDIVISGAGQKHLIKKDMVKKNAILIDAGISYENNRMYGDVDFEQVKKEASHITPTPGGVGPITVAKLFENLAKTI